MVQNRRSTRASLSLIVLWPLFAPTTLAQVQVQKIHADEAFTIFGSDLAIDGQTLAVGTNGNRVEIYQLDGDYWSLAQTLSDPGGDPQSEFGATVAVHGDFLLVGASNDQEAGYGAGAAHVFERVNDQWQWSQKLIGSDTNVDDHFGRAVALDGTRAVIGAPFVRDPGEQTGAAYIFEYTGTQLGWLQLARLSDVEGDDFARLGDSVAIEGDLAIVAVSGDSTLEPAQGAAMVFRRLPTGWVLDQKLKPFDPQPLQGYGSSVSLSGDTIAIGSNTDGRISSNGGSVYTYKYEESGWALEQKILPPLTTPVGLFGRSVALQGERLVVGSQQDVASLTGVGRAFLFEREGQTWNWTNALLPGTPTANLFFSSRVAMDGELIVCAAPFDEEGGSYAGAAFLFSLTEFAAPFCFCDQGSPCGNEAAQSGCEHAAGIGAKLAASGSGSAIADDLVLIGTDLPPHRPSIICVGAGRDRQAFGDGQFCLSGVGGIRRFPVDASDSGGTLTLGPGLAAYSQTNFEESLQFRAGETRHFQIWFRDPHGPCGSLSNLSHGLTVAFGL